MRRISILMLMLFTLFALAAWPQAGAQSESPAEPVPAVTHNTWSSGAAMPTALKFPMAGAIKGQIYVVGGVTDTAVVASNQIYNPLANTWSTGAEIPVTTFDGAAAVVKNVLYIFGGNTDGVTLTNAVWAYNPKKNEWSAKTAMPTTRESAAAAVEKNVIYVIGGVDQHQNRLNTVESYNPVTDTWTEEAPLLVGKSEPSAGLIGSTIVAADGFTSSWDTGDNEGYSASTNSWQSLASDPTPRNSACGGSIKGQLYVAGGWNNSVTLNVTESFKKKWTTLASMPQAVVSPGFALNAGQLYCIGGGDNGTVFRGNVFNYVQIYQP